jgi:hypothetical protein
VWGVGEGEGWWDWRGALGPSASQSTAYQITTYRLKKINFSLFAQSIRNNWVKMLNGQKRKCFSDLITYCTVSRIKIRIYFNPKLEMAQFFLLFRGSVSYYAKCGFFNSRSTQIFHYS